MSKTRAESQTVFVDRLSEMKELFDQLQESITSQVGRLVVVKGEPGIGKSSLVETFLAGIARRDVLVLQTSGKELISSPYMALSELLGPIIKDSSGFGRQVIRNVGNLIQLIPIGLLAPGYSGMASAVSSAFKMAAGLSQSDKRIISNSIYVKNLFVSFFEHASREKHLITFFDDVQWFDPSSLEVLTYLLERMTHFKVLFILGLREGFPHSQEERITSQKINEFLLRLQGTLRTIKLDSLDSESSKEMASKLLGGQLLDDASLNQLAMKSEGNPFFIKSTAAEIIANKNEYFATPSGLVNLDSLITQSSIAEILKISLKRVESFNPLARRMLDYAAVLGNEFDLPTLSKFMAEDSLTTVHLLEDMDSTFQMIRQIASEEGMYSFNHSITREVVLSLLRPVLKELNRKAASTYAQIGGKPQLVALHYDKAGEEKLALEFYEKAAELASANYSYANSVQYIERCLDLLDSERVEITDPRRKKLLLSLAENRFSNGDFERAYKDCQRILEGKADDPRIEADAMLLAGRACRYMNTKDSGNEGIDYLRRAAERYESLEDKAKLAETYSILSTVLDHFSKHVSAVKYYGKSQIASNEANDILGLAILQRKSGMVYDSRRAIPYIEEAKRTFEKLNATIEIARCLNNLGMERFYLGEFQTAKKNLEESIDLYRKIDGYEIDAAINNLGIVLTQLGETSLAHTVLNEALEKAGNEYRRSTAIMNLSIVDWLEGRINEGYLRMKQLATSIDMQAEPIIQDYYGFNMASFLLNLGNSNEAMEWLEKYPVNEWKNDEILAQGKRLSLKAKILTLQGRLDEAGRCKKMSEEIFVTHRPQKWFYQLGYYPCDIHLLD